MKTHAWFLLALAIFSVTISPQASAKTFRNAYVSFDLADRWDCQLEQTEWVCRTKPGPNDNREAVIILTAKEVGPSDSLPAYEQHLKTPRTIPSRTGQPIQSQIQKVESRMINQHTWIDGMHFASEVPNYYTRYLATTKDKIAILVTFSAHKAHYAKYSNDFFRAIESLRVVATKNLMGAGGSGGGSGAPGSGLLGSGNSGGVDFGDEIPELGSGSKGMSAPLLFVLFLALIAGGVGLYLILGKKKKKPAKKK